MWLRRGGRRENASAKRHGTDEYQSHGDVEQDSPSRKRNGVHDAVWVVSLIYVVMVLIGEALVNRPSTTGPPVGTSSKVVEIETSFSLGVLAER